MITMGKGNELINHEIGNLQLTKYQKMINLLSNIKTEIKTALK